MDKSKGSKFFPKVTELTAITSVVKFAENTKNPINQTDKATSTIGL
ncbi:MAG: hypothetical protein WCX97_05280 [Candidatus Magasanikbacteria bacterium]